MCEKVELRDKYKFIRAKRNITQYQMAKIIGSNQTEISFIERGFIPENSNKIRAIEELYFEDKGKHVSKTEVN